MPGLAIDAQGVSKRFVLRRNRDASLKVRALSLFDRRRREVREEALAQRIRAFAAAPECIQQFFHDPVRIAGELPHTGV